MENSQQYDFLRLLQDRIQKLRAAKAIVSLVSFTNAASEVAPKVIARFKPIHHQLQSILESVQANEALLSDMTKEGYREFRQTSSALTQVAESLAALDFFRNSTLKDLVFSTMHLCYRLEAEIKIRAYEKEPFKKTDDDLKRALSHSGMKAIHKRL
jgi:hypothetical protein